MGMAQFVVTAIFGVLFLVLVAKHQQMKWAFRIDPNEMVRGDVRLQVGVTDVDISTLEAGFGGGPAGGGLCMPDGVRPANRGGSSQRDALLGVAGEGGRVPELRNAGSAAVGALPSGSSLEGAADAV